MVRGYEGAKDRITRHLPIQHWCLEAHELMEGRRWRPFPYIGAVTNEALSPNGNSHLLDNVIC